MNPVPGPAIAEAVGRKMLGLKGSELMELLYFLEEPQTLELLRAFVACGAEDQAKIIRFLKGADQLGARLCA